MVQGEHTNKFDTYSPIYKHEDSQKLATNVLLARRGQSSLDAGYKQFSELPSCFAYFRYRRRLYTTEEANLIFARFTGKIGLHDGRVYANNYVGTLKIENRKILEYAEYFYPFIMARAFDIKL